MNATALVGQSVQGEEPGKSPSEKVAIRNMMLMLMGPKVIAGASTPIEVPLPSSLTLLLEGCTLALFTGISDGH